MPVGVRWRCWGEGVTQAEGELDVDDEFEEEEVGGGHGLSL